MLSQHYSKKKYVRDSFGNLFAEKLRRFRLARSSARKLRLDMIALKTCLCDSGLTLSGKTFFKFYKTTYHEYKILTNAQNPEKNQ